jgi:VanZ family protein
MIEGNTANLIYVITSYVSAVCVILLGIISYIYRRKTRSKIATLLLFGFLLMLIGWPIVFISSFFPIGFTSVASLVQSISNTLGLAVVTAAFFIFTKNEKQNY